MSEEVPRERVQGQSSAHMPSICSESALHQLKATYSSDSTKTNSDHRKPSVVLDKSTEDSRVTVRPPLPIGAALLETDGKTSDDQATLTPSVTQGTEPQETTVPAVYPTPST
jgi:hypothetical protein